MGFSLGGIANGAGGANPCCCGGSCTTKICCLSPCGSGNPGTAITVTIKSGATTISSGTVGSDGCVTLSIPHTGSYTVTTTGNARYGNTTGTYTLNCGGTQDIALSAGTGYSCQCGWTEPVPRFLTVTGGGATTTWDTNTTAFTLSPTIGNYLATNIFGNCTGSVHVNSCTTGAGTLNVHFSINRVNCTVQETWGPATDCMEIAPCTPVSYPYYQDVASINGLVPQYTIAGICFGYCTLDEFNIQSLTGSPGVPVNVTITFGPGLGGTTPPIGSITITE